MARSGWPAFRWLLVFLIYLCNGCQRQRHDILLHTDQGDIRLQLLAGAPRHAANFEKLVREKFYDGQLVHRVVQDFTIQTGDPGSRVATPGMRLGNGDPGYSLPAEMGALPLRGALAATQQAGGNGAQRSNGAQFFIVQGRQQTEASLNAWEKKMQIHFSLEARRLYQLRGGAPQLQGQCTVFGQVVAGMEVVDKIAALPRDANERPLQDIRIWLKIME
ncbi:MAG: peptidylprolyl isomerase [Saprospiraceae bacterium]